MEKGQVHSDNIDALIDVLIKAGTSAVETAVRQALRDVEIQLSVADLESIRAIIREESLGIKEQKEDG